MYELLKLFGVLLFLYTLFALYTGTVRTIMGSLPFKFERRVDPEMYWLVCIIYLVCVYLLLFNLTPGSFQFP